MKAFSKKTSWLLIIAILLNLFPVRAVADNGNDSGYAVIESVEEEEIEIDLKIDNNPGCKEEPEEPEEYSEKDNSLVYVDGFIRIFNYYQLSLIGSNSQLMTTDNAHYKRIRTSECCGSFGDEQSACWR